MEASPSWEKTTDDAIYPRPGTCPNFHFRIIVVLPSRKKMNRPVVISSTSFFLFLFPFLFFLFLFFLLWKIDSHRQARDNGKGKEEGPDYDVDERPARKAIKSNCLGLAPTPFYPQGTRMVA